MSDEAVCRTAPASPGLSKNFYCFTDLIKVLSDASLLPATAAAVGATSKNETSVCQARPRCNVALHVIIHITVIED